jgi:hypothetical protein
METDDLGDYSELADGSVQAHFVDVDGLEPLTDGWCVAVLRDLTSESLPSVAEIVWDVRQREGGLPDHSDDEIYARRNAVTIDYPITVTVYGFEVAIQFVFASLAEGENLMERLLEDRLDLWTTVGRKSRFQWRG